MADLGAYFDIRISVTDGAATVALPSFSITVTDSAAGFAALSWTPPTQNTDGSSLTNLAGYEIRYGLDAAELTESLRVTNPSVSNVLVENLTPGAWYFGITALNSGGVASPLSGLASKTIS